MRLERELDCERYLRRNCGNGNGLSGKNLRLYSPMGAWFVISRMSERLFPCLKKMEQFQKADRDV